MLRLVGVAFSFFLLVLPLELIASNAESETNKIEDLRDKIAKLSNKEADNKLALSKEVYALSLQSGDQSLQAEILNEIGIIYQSQAFYDIAASYFTQSLDLFAALRDSAQQASLFLERGYNSLLHSDFDAAISDYQQALKIYEVQQDKNQIADIKLGLCSLYLTYFQNKNKSSALQAENLAEAKKYFDQATVQLAKLSPDTRSKAYAMQGRLLRSEKNFKAAANSFLQAIHISDSMGNTLDRVYTEVNLGAHYLYWGDYLLENNAPEKATTQFRKAYPHFLHSLEFHQRENGLQGIVHAYINFGAMYKRLASYQQGIDSLRKAMSIAKSHELIGDLAHVSRLMAQSYEAMGLADSALVYHKAYKNYQDQVFSEKNERTMRFTEVHFETEKIEKDKLRAEQESKERGFQLQISIVSGVLIAMLLGALGFYYYQRNKTQKQLNAQQREINSQLVVDLVKEQAIESLNARLEGQENERQRIARELHDQLGGTLSAAKLCMQGIKRKLPPGNEEQYNLTYTLIQQACDETRQLSHDMLALPLKHHGLEASIQQLCKTINNSGKLSIEFNTIFQKPLEISQKAERHLYRIVQELIQNVIKHAQAKSVILQISTQAKNLTLMLEDDGVGFDPEKQKSDRGMGMENIHTRLRQLSGSIDIDSQPGRGTTIIIEVPLTENQPIA